MRSDIKNKTNPTARTYIGSPVKRKLKYIERAVARSKMKVYTLTIFAKPSNLNFKIFFEEKYIITVRIRVIATIMIKDNQWSAKRLILFCANKISDEI